jgi:predicted aldo/keto reductase-like oxidoreductase
MYSPDRRNFLKVSAISATTALVGHGVLAVPARQEKTPARGAKKIIKRKLGKTGLELPVVSMGVMRSDNPSLVRAALEAGIVHLDTAHGYQGGKNEQMLGELLKGYPRESFVIATKIHAEGKEEFAEALDLSLERLQMKYVDILYLHGVSSRGEALDAEILGALKKAKESGKTRHVGMSTHKNQTEVLRAAVESGVHEVVLAAVNFKEDNYPDLKKAIAEAAAAGIGIVGMKTMAGGFFDRDRKKPVNCKAALKWVLQDENVHTTIPGITSFEMLAENVSVNTDLTLTEKERADIAAGTNEQGLYCQACGECTVACSRNAPIPDIMRAYMYTYGYGDAAQGHELLASLNIKGNPCSDCGVCPVRCVKGFPVAEKIADITRLAAVPAEFLS